MTDRHPLLELAARLWRHRGNLTAVNQELAEEAAWSKMMARHGLGPVADPPPAMAAWPDVHAYCCSNRPSDPETASLAAWHPVESSSKQVSVVITAPDNGSDVVMTVDPDPIYTVAELSDLVARVGPFPLRSVVIADGNEVLWWAPTDSLSDSNREA